MYYPGPERYQVQESRQPQFRNEPEYYPNVYRPQSQSMQPPPSLTSPYPQQRELFGYGQVEPVPRMRVVEPSDQGEELLDRLEQTGRVPSKDKFRRMACNV